LRGEYVTVYAPSQAHTLIFVQRTGSQKLNSAIRRRADFWFPETLSRSGFDRR
jgi:hypothetical protein